MVLYAVADNKPQDRNMTTQQTSNSASSSHDSLIHSLTRQKDELQRSLDWWNIAYIVALTGTVVIGAFAGLSQYRTIMLSKRLVSVQSELENEKDRKLTSDLKAKDVEIQTAKESAAKAEQAAAEANLARVKIEQRMSSRALDDTTIKDLTGLLAPYHRTHIDIVVFDVHVGEPLIFSDQLAALFVSAGFAGVRHWEAQQTEHRLAGTSVIVAVAVGHEDEFRELAGIFGSALRALGIDCGVGVGVFGCVGPNMQGITKAYEFRSPQYLLRFEKPKQYMGIRAVAPFRVQVGEKKLIPIPPIRPASPPQA
jgi:hypothetical protein